MNRPDAPAESDDAVDVEGIVLSLREQLRRRRASAEEQGIDFDALARGDHRTPRPLRLPPTLHDAVFEAEMSADTTRIAPGFVKSALPILGRIVDRVKLRAHRLALSYVELAARRQSAFNVQVAASLSQLVAALEAEETANRAHVAEIAALRSEVERLQQRIDLLERRE